MKKEIKIEYCRPALPKGWKRFKSDRCGYQFIKRVDSVVVRCPKCEEACIAIGFKNKRLDPYSALKLYWIENPTAWTDNIKHRVTENRADDENHTTTKNYVVDDRGRRIGELPKIHEIN